MEKQDLRDIIKKIIKKIGPLAQKKYINFTEDIDSFELFADKRDLEKVIFNLLHNAIKFSHKDSHIVVKLNKNGNFSVEDFGTGISEKDISHILDRFYKADTSRSFTEESGSGLGLSIVKEICDRNNWYIKVASREKKGSTFIINF